MAASTHTTRASASPTKRRPVPTPAASRPAAVAAWRAAQLERQRTSGGQRPAPAAQPLTTGEPVASYEWPLRAHGMTRFFRREGWRLLHSARPLSTAGSASAVMKSMTMKDSTTIEVQVLAFGQ